MQDSQNAGFREAAWVWAGFGAVAIATLVTYARIPAFELYHVSGSGLGGGLGRVLVLLNFPTALVAVAILALCADRLGLLGLLPALLCAVVVLPGVVDQDDLDAKAVNAVPAAGVALALTITVVALRRGGLGARGSRHGDRVRIVLAALIGLAAIPWIFAELGFYAPWPFLAEEGTPLAAVHLGRHHGTDGVLLALSALALSRQLPRFRRRGLARAAGVYLGVMLTYGLANAAEDFWHEQVVKRGWTEARLPSMLNPELSTAWAVIVVSGLAVYALYEVRSRSYVSHSDMGT